MEPYPRAVIWMPVRVLPASALMAWLNDPCSKWNSLAGPWAEGLRTTLRQIGFFCLRGPITTSLTKSTTLKLPETMLGDSFRYNVVTLPMVDDGYSTGSQR